MTAVNVSQLVEMSLCREKAAINELIASREVELYIALFPGLGTRLYTVLLLYLEL